MEKKDHTHKITSSKAIKIFKKLGFKQVLSIGGGSHMVFKKNPNDIDFLVLVKYGNNPIIPNAIKRMLENGKITEKQYLNAFNSI